MTAFATIDELRESLAQPAKRTRSPEYVARMMHEVPDAVVIERERFILSRAADKVVLDIGASGPMHEAIKGAARKTYGIDRPPPGWSMLLPHEDGQNYGIDLDDVRAELPKLEDVELVVCGEVIEHLGNPGWFLKRLRMAYPGVPVIVSVPNAFSEIARKHMADDVENVNLDHRAWYSWRTLKTLVEGCGYGVGEFYWYGAGKPGFTEGLVFVLIPTGSASDGNYTGRDDL